MITKKDAIEFGLVPDSDYYSASSSYVHKVKGEEEEEEKGVIVREKKRGGVKGERHIAGSIPKKKDKRLTPDYKYDSDVVEQLTKYK